MRPNRADPKSNVTVAQRPHDAQPPKADPGAPPAVVGDARTEAFRDAGAGGPTDLEGARAGYTSPVEEVDQTFTPEERVQYARKIPCPALAGFFQAGMLKVARDGTVETKDLERTLSQAGPSKSMRKVLVRGADRTDKVEGQFNLFKLRESRLNHANSTGIRGGPDGDEINPARFTMLKAFSEDGKILTQKNLDDAAEHFAKDKHEPGKNLLDDVRGSGTQLAELNLAAEVFGRTAADGSKYFTIDDAYLFFVEGKIRPDWEPPVVPGNVSIAEVLGDVAAGVFRRWINDV
jgi:hypothetical protein